MTKMENKKESICFNFEKDKQKQIFFDKTKKCGIINNNNSVFLNKILSIKNQSLLNNNIKKYPSEIFKKINSSSDNKKQNNINNTNNTNRSFNRNNKTNEFKQNSLTNLFEEMNINSPHIISNSNSNIFSPKLVSSKIIVNKNKNLGMSTHKERDKDRDKDKDKEYNYNDVLPIINKVSKLNEIKETEEDQKDENNEYNINNSRKKSASDIVNNVLDAISNNLIIAEDDNPDIETCSFSNIEKLYIFEIILFYHISL